MQLNPGKSLLEAIDRANTDLRDLSLKIHSHPELGYKEYYAHKTVTDFMAERGFHVTRHACGIETAFIAEYVHQGNDANDMTPLRSVGFCSEVRSVEDRRWLHLKAQLCVWVMTLFTHSTSRNFFLVFYRNSTMLWHLVEVVTRSFLDKDAAIT
jgi:hypothetical protein